MNKNSSNGRVQDEQQTESRLNSLSQTEANEVRLVENRTSEHDEQQHQSKKDTENKTEHPLSVKEENITTPAFLGNLLKEYEKSESKQRQSTNNTNND
ncbi:MAG: hypothetical protein WBQ25_00940 [Nitrososphaeraceae archaeon]